MQPNSVVNSFNIEATIENEAVLKHQMTNHNTNKGHVITGIEVSKRVEKLYFHLNAGKVQATSECVIHEQENTTFNIYR